jgi:hypothetical protein
LLRVRSLSAQLEEESPVAMYTAPVKLWLTEDRSRVVEDGDKEAAHLFLPKGHEIPMEMAQKYGLADKPAKKASKPAEDKKASKPADKSATKPANKARA